MAGYLDDAYLLGDQSATDTSLQQQQQQQQQSQFYCSSGYCMGDMGRGGLCGEELELDMRRHIQACACTCNHMGYGNYMDYQVSF